MDYEQLHRRMIEEITAATGLIVDDSITWAELVELHIAGVE